MATNTYDKGDAVRLRVTFTIDSVNTDPTTITLRVKNPVGTKTVYTFALAEITKEATGIYYKDISVDDDGIYAYRFEGTGTVEAASEHKMKVRTSEF